MAFGPPRYGGDVTAPLPSKPRTFDPVAMDGLGEWQLAWLLYDGLFRLVRQGAAPEPQLAVSLTVQGTAQRQVIISLRRGLRTHRGSPIGASDAAASLRRLLGSPAGWLLGAVAGVSALDGHRVKVQLFRSCPELAAVLSAPQAAILPRGLVPGPSPDGTGAFRHARGRLQDPIRLSAYAGHISGRPYLDSVTLVPYARRHDEVSAFYLGRSLLSFHGVRLFGRALDHIGLPSSPPPLDPPRLPSDLEFDFDLTHDDTVDSSDETNLSTPSALRTGTPDRPPIRRRTSGAKRPADPATATLTATTCSGLAWTATTGTDASDAPPKRTPERARAERAERALRRIRARHVRQVRRVRDRCPDRARMEP